MSIPIIQLCVTSTTASFELMTNSCFYSNFKYNIFLNGKIYARKYCWNVIVLHELEPETNYEIEIYTLSSVLLNKHHFKTKKEMLRLNVRQFNASGDGHQDDTMAFQTAIMACPSGGRILVEPGIYRVGPLFLKSNMTLELLKGATLLASVERKCYPILPQICGNQPDKSENYAGTWEGEPATVYASLINGFHLENCSIVGEGTIDGNGEAGGWWSDHEKEQEVKRPRLIFFSHCKNMIIQGITLKNSPSWTIHPYYSEYIDLINLKIVNPQNSPNTDGINPESCQYVNIAGCDISVGDDCIAIKSGKYMMGSLFKKSSIFIKIRNCCMREGHGAVVLGSEMSGGIKEVDVIKCLFINTEKGLRIKTRRGRGKTGIIDQIHFENIEMTGVLTPFVINMYYFCDKDGKIEYVWKKEKMPVDEKTPYIGHVIFKNIECKKSEVAAAYFYGLPEQKIKTIHMENIKISFTKNARLGKPAMMSHIEPVSRMGIYINHVEKAILKNICLKGVTGEPVQIFNTRIVEE